MNAQEWSESRPAPAGFAAFGAEPFVRSLLDPERKIEHWSEFERSGHFPAMEQPALLIDDLRAFFRRYRQAVLHRRPAMSSPAHLGLIIDHLEEGGSD